VREVGTEWLCLQAARQLGLDTFLAGQRWPADKVNLALSHIVARAVYPASELRTVDWMRQNSAIGELTSVDTSRITKDKLYGISKYLYSIENELCTYLSKKTNELFDLHDRILLFDLTNTYFEGRKLESEIAKFGRSKEKRADARLVVLALVVNPQGFIKYMNVHNGNLADCKSLSSLLERLGKATSDCGRHPTVVLDAGIATDENLAMLRKSGYDYLCVSRTKLKDYKADEGQVPVQVTDKRDRPITLLKIRKEAEKDTFMYVRSETKALKERSMNQQFIQRFEDGLEEIKLSLGKKGGVKKQEKVWIRIGRLKQKYPSVQGAYNIETQINEKQEVSLLTWVRKPEQASEKEQGIYFLRTSLDENDEHTLWTIYNTIREIESTFRTLKTDLDLRPIFHKTDSGTLAHLHLGILAYWLVATVRYQLKNNGIHSDWSNIVRQMNTQKMVSTQMENKNKDLIKIRQSSEPSEQVKKIYLALGYKAKPPVYKKSVWHPIEPRITNLQQNQPSKASG
jgi:hypothetical protein